MTENQILDIASRGLLRIDETGSVRVLVKDKSTGRTRNGRRVNRQTVSDMRSRGALYTGTNSETFTFLHPAL